MNCISVLARALAPFAAACSLLFASPGTLTFAGRTFTVTQLKSR